METISVLGTDTDSLVSAPFHMGRSLAVCSSSCERAYFSKRVDAVQTVFCVRVMQ